MNASTEVRVACDRRGFCREPGHSGRGVGRAENPGTPSGRKIDRLSDLAVNADPVERRAGDAGEIA
jgi:hypothetical protein